MKVLLLSIILCIFAFKLKIFVNERFESHQSCTRRKKRTAKWLAEELGKNPATVSKWCTNVSQPDLYTLEKIATLLDIDKRELITGKE